MRTLALVQLLKRIFFEYVYNFKPQSFMIIIKFTVEKNPQTKAEIDSLEQP